MTALFAPEKGYLLLALLLVGGFAVLALMLHRLDSRLSDLRSRLDRDLPARIDEKAMEVGHAVAFTALGLRFPVFLGGSSIDSFHAKYLVEHLLSDPPRTILELGSGSSTILIARVMEAQGAPPYAHIAVEHDAAFLDRSRAYARLNGVADRITFAHCPLVPIETLRMEWYADVPDLLAGRRIDLLIVDGPPAYRAGQERARLPALEVLYPHLAAKCTVILDDANRPGEVEVFRAWTRAYPEFRVKRLRRGKGIAILSR
jgi:predicted O-methyltransferase YrrM